MKYLFLILLATPCLAGGPKYTYSDPRLNDEIANIYHDIRSVVLGDVRISSVTIGTATISNLRGVTDASVPCTGCVGEYVESITGFVDAPTSGQWGDLTSLSLTAGDWDVTALIDWSRNSATWTVIYGGISTTSGDSSTGLVLGSNWLAYDFTVAPTNVNQMPMTIVSYRVNISATTTYYLKYYALRGANTPQAKARFSARRVR